MKSVFYGLKTQNNMDIKLKYRAWVGEKHADISHPLINSDIETFAIEFAEWLVKNCFIPDVSNNEVAVCDHPDEAIIMDGDMDYCMACSTRIPKQTDC